MAQKDKVKELVGRSLNSYHTKSLQQIDRIEKKNKEQNHKISILSNELDNDYLTKTEEGSVVSLEHSKEGMVYLDELQGNTLVNYCTDGSKEITLNGDIDVEGTNVTLTEGVDNGLVDVVCEGNTLVNLVNREWSYGTTTTYKNRDCYIVDKTSSPKQDIFTTKKGGTYTLIYDYASNTLTNGTTNPFKRVHLTLYNDKTWLKDIDVKNFESNKNEFTRNISVFTIPTDIDYTRLYMVAILRDVDGTVWLDKDVMLLEGDWSNKELPHYFEGMKSVGQDDENGHKIEILSQNKNLWNVEVVKKQNGVKPSYTKNNNIITYSEIGEYGIYVPIKVKKGETLRISGIVKNVQNIRIFRETDNFVGSGIYNIDYNGIETEVSPHYICTFPEDGVYHIRVWCKNTGTPILTDFLAEISSANTTYVEHKSNKKEILLNEPLRGLPSGVKDKKVKIGNKWYIERNCGTFTFNGSESGWTKRDHLSEDYETYSIIDPYLDEIVKYDYISTVRNNDLVCDKLISLPIIGGVSEMYNKNYACTALISNGSTSSAGRGYYINIAKSTLGSKTINQWLSENNITIVFKNLNPIYEPLEIEPILNTYNDVTHISNNSIIPCNMKIQNSGYNAIIKPSTLYTIALDTNKSGTIGMNLGGAKGTTTNNVLKLTTPATLTDDSLRLYGKGIKGSKVRLLEGDKTNWIPSFFEGMKSSFEDKLQDDGSYKMEILSNNENLLILEKEPYFWRNSNKSIATRRDDKIIINGLVNQGWDAINLGYSSLLKSDTKYTITCKINQNMNVNHGVALRYKHNGIIVSTSNYLWGGGNVNVSKYTFTTPRISFDTIEVGYMVTWDGDKLTQTYTNLEFSEIGINEVYNPNKSNKIQFSSIEPLRGLANGVRDRLCIKDNKLMIERNCGKVVLDGDTTKASYSGGIQPNKKYHNIIIKINNDKSAMKSFDEKYKCIAIDKMPYLLHAYLNVQGFGMNQYVDPSATFVGCIPASILGDRSKAQYFKDNPTTIIYNLAEPTYEEIPFELQKIILENYENGTLFFDTNIPPTSTVTYAGETPIVKSVKLNKTEVLNNTNDINDNIVPYLMDMDYRVVCLQLATEENEVGVSMARLFGGAYEMLQRDIQSKRYSTEEYRHRLDAYLSANKITEEEYIKLGDMLNE